MNAVTYYHVELSRHDVLWPRIPAGESYLDTGNRYMFENGGRSLCCTVPGTKNDQARRDKRNLRAVSFAMPSERSLYGIACSTRGEAGFPPRAMGQRTIRCFACRSAAGIRPVRSRVANRYGVRLPRIAMMPGSFLAVPCPSRIQAMERRSLQVGRSDPANRTSAAKDIVATSHWMIRDWWMVPVGVERTTRQCGAGTGWKRALPLRATD